MWKWVSTAIDDYRIWYKITFQRGRILTTPAGTWRRYHDPALADSPSNFFPGSNSPARVEEIPLPSSRRVRVTRLEFPSLHPLPFEETNRAVGHLFSPTQIQDKALVAVSHGWAHRNRMGLVQLYVRPLLRSGFSVLLMAHPLHFERTPSGAYSGELMVSGDAQLTVEAFRQAVTDLGAAVTYLQNKGWTRWGLLGYSLGGYIAGLLGAVRSDAAFLVVAGCGDSILSPILETRLGRNVREDLSLSGLLSDKRLERYWEQISLSRWEPALSQEDILLVAGRFDRIMLPESVERLWEAWKRPEIHWLDRGHYTLLATPGLLFKSCIPFMKNRIRTLR